MRRFFPAFFLSMFAAPLAAQVCPPEHIVASGDTLSTIAERYLGDPLEYRAIHEINTAVIGPDAGRIEIGMVLVLPCAEPVLATAFIADGRRALPPLQEERRVSTVENWSVLMEPEIVAEWQDKGVQIVDIRSPKAQAGGVIPGSLSLPYSLWRGDKKNPGKPPSAQELSLVIGQSGLRLDEPIIIVNAKREAFDTGRAAYIYWLLKSLGATDLALVKGGFDGWKEANLDVVAETATLPPYKADLFMDQTWYATGNEVNAIASGTVKGTLLDARPAKFFRKLSDLGLPTSTTLPDAQNSPATALHVKIGTDTTQQQDGIKVLMDLKESRVNWDSETVVSFCNTGELGALNWFYASELSGIDNVKLYPESTKGWVASGHQLVPPSDS
ncbi:rhodanese-like domain-containing protein [Algicella marina]|uniref:LysM peptidoglycan-binding domain-containing protein n=1 Tax=Algicella marina TaxID=2683284 RepID=A0A6P1T291_9RHOB|nr:rhodanese-like domain-containing protein [Algicella marina]QHQ35773.1 LysM peptidoglycan-binding domain-containing protein [Algicella marina]